MTVFSNVASNIVPGGPAILFHGKLTNFVVKEAQECFLLIWYLKTCIPRHFSSTLNNYPLYANILICGLKLCPRRAGHLIS